MIVPLDARYATYAANRGPLAIPQASLQANAVTDPVQGSFGLHPRMTQTRELCSTRASSRSSPTSACCCARPPRPTTRTSTQLPPQLFSHSDMQDHWQTGLSAGAGQRRLGRAARGPDPVAPIPASLSVSISTASSGVFLKGTRRSRIRSAPTTQRSHDADRPAHPRVARLGHRATAPIRRRSTRTRITMARANMLEDQFGDVATRSVEINDFILSALYNGPDGERQLHAEKIPINTVFPAGNPLAAQLRSVAMMIAARQALGVKRQIFFVSVGGSFDNAQRPVRREQQRAAARRRRSADPVRQACRSAGPGRRRAQGLLRRDRRARRAEQRHDVHRIRFRPHAHVERQGLRSWLGLAPHGDGRRDRSAARSTARFHNMQVGAGNPADAGQGRLIPTYSVDQYAATLGSGWARRRAI